MRLAILGGTSKLAKSFMDQVLHHGYDVASLIPHNSTPHIKHDKLATANGSWENESALRETLQDCHVAVCMPEAQQNAASMAAFVAAAHEAGVRRVIVVTDVVAQSQGDEPTAAGMLSKTNLDWTVVHAGQSWQEEFIAPIHDIAAFVVQQISDVSHLSETVLVRS